jgi:hypothetical protein
MRKLQRRLLNIPNDSFALKGEFMWIKSVGGVEVARSPWMRNKVVTSEARGLSIVLDRLAEINTYSLNITHAEIGDDNTAATAADTSLGNGLVRVSKTTAERSGNQVTFRFFFPDATTPDDTYEEIGLFIDGTATLDSGRIFNHLIFGIPMVKATGEDYTIVARITGSV